MNTQKLIQYMEENKWLIGAILFFILWKFFLIHILWQDRLIPPEPDDSYNYIAQITSIADCEVFHPCSSTTISIRDDSGFTYLSYRLFFGLLAKITHLSPQTIYHISFYVGTLLLALILYPFISIFTKNKPLIAWSIFVLSFYHGLGETHGFFWVVPSFFSVLLFFVLAIYLLREEIAIKAWLVFLLTVLFTFSHPTSIFLVFIFPLYLFILFLLTKKTTPILWKRAVSVILLTVFLTILPNHLLPRPDNTSDQNAYSLRATVTRAHSIITKLTSKKETGEQKTSHSSETQSTLASNHSSQNHSTVAQNSQQESFSWSQKIAMLHNTYFRFVWFHPVCMLPWLLCLFVLLWKRTFEILAFFIASLLFFMVATLFNPFGYRSVIILWPLTYILLAFSSWHLISMVREHTAANTRKILLGILCALLLAFFAINATFAFIFNENMSRRNNYLIEPALVEYVVHKIPLNQTVMVPLELALAEMWSLPVLRTRITTYAVQPDYIILTDLTKIPAEKRSLLFQTVERVAEKFGISMRQDRPTVPYTKPSGYTFEESFGMFDIYKKLP